MDITTKSEVRSLSPIEAQSFLDNNNFHLQRSLKGSHVVSLTLAMENGEFPPGTALFFVQTPNRLDMIDGQHRLKAQIATDISIDYTVVTFVTSDDAAASILYTQLDIGAKRTISDRMKALNLSAHVNIPQKLATIFASGAPYLKYRFNSITPQQINQMTPLQRMDVIKEFEQGAVLFFECMSSADKWITKPFMKPHLVALGAYICQYAPEQGRVFWTSMANNDFKGTKDPRSQIFSLVQNIETKTLAIRRSITVVQAFIHGWNAWIEGKDIEKKLSIAPIPAANIKILGVNDVGITDLSIPDEHVKTQTEVIGEVMDQLAKLYPKAA